MSEAKKDESDAAKWRRRTELTDKLLDALADCDPDAARHYAEELAELLGEEAWGTRAAWCEIWEARGRLDMAVEVGERDLEECLAELEERASRIGEHAPALREDVEDVLDGYYLQAKRYLTMAIPGAAKAMMLEAQEISSRYRVPFDETLQEFFGELCEEE
jgi:hypothetical protein